MASEWRIATVAELQREGILLVEDGNHGEYRPRPDEFTDLGVAFIRASDIDDGRVLFESASKINETARQRITKGIGAPGDVLLSHKGTVGKVALVPGDAPPFVCSPQTTFWRTLNDHQLDRVYLYAFLRSPGFHAQLATRSGETDMAPYVSLTSQRGLPVTLPPIGEQRAIAHIIGPLDDKIELNRRMNETLEAMAQTIFKSWFVDFDPVHAKATGYDTGLYKDLDNLFSSSFQDTEIGEIPVDWRLNKIGDMKIVVLDFVANGSFASLGENVTVYEKEEYAYFIRNVDLKINVFNKYIDENSYNFLTKTKMFGNEVIISNVGDVGSVFLCPILSKPMTLGNNMIMLKSTSNVNYNFYIYLLFKHNYGKDLIKSITTGSAQPKFNKTDFRNLFLIVPPDGIIEAFNAKIIPIYKKININNNEIYKLTHIRDLLLQKLINGEIRVPIKEV